MKRLDDLVSKINIKLPSVSMLCLFAITSLMTSCGINSANNIFSITARNDFEDTSVISPGANAPITVPVIVNDKVVRLVDLNFSPTGLSSRAFNYDNTVTPYNTDTQMSFHINGGNPPQDGADMAGSVSLDPASRFDLLDTVKLIYTPASNGFGADWFSYTPLGVNGASDTAYVFVRYIRIAADQYEPDDFIQFARDITDYVFPVGTHLRETHNSDYHNPSPRACSAYRFIGGMSIAGDRDWFLVRLPTGANTLNITIRGSTPHQQAYSERGQFDNLENELAITLVEEVTGLPPPRPTNGPIAERYTQNPEPPFPRPYWITSRPSGAFTHLIQLNRNSKNPTPEGLWFKWPLDDASGFPTTVGTGKVFIRINPRPTIYSPPCSANPAYEPHGDYRIDFLMGNM